MTFRSMMATFPDISPGNDLPKLILSNPSGLPIPVIEAELEAIMSLIEEQEHIRFREIELVYVDEDHIIEVNKEYLDRDYVTDIISFRYDEDETNSTIEGTLFCCAPRIIEQSSEAETSIESEFYRIFIHGLLHLAGYDDQTKDDKETMTSLENSYLQQTGLDL